MLATLLTAMMIDEKALRFNYNCHHHTKKLRGLSIWTEKWENEAGDLIDLSKEITNLFESGYNSIFQSDIKIFFRSE